MDARVTAQEFCRACQAMLKEPGLPLEFTYRVSKILDRFMPLMDKMYLKTLKGAETLFMCSVKAKILGENLRESEDFVYLLLTDLEKTHEELLKKTYEFRVKAG